MKKAKLWIGVVLVGLITVITLQNTEPVETRLLFATLVMPRSALLALTFATGFLAGYLLRMRDATK